MSILPASCDTISIDEEIRAQLGQRTLSPDAAALLRGKLYNSRKLAVPNQAGANQYTEVKAQNEQRPTTAESISAETGVSRETVKRDAKFAEAVEKLGIKEVWLVHHQDVVHGWLGTQIMKNPITEEIPPPCLVDSVLGAVGNTPLVKLSRITRGLEGAILAKLEYLNPGLSKKDRIALQMIEEAEADGRLRPGQTVVELTSGNTGAGLSIVCAVKGYPFVAVISKGNSVERSRMMKAFGAQVMLVDQSPGSKPGQVSGADLALVEEAAQRITKERNAFRADQFHLESSARAHFLHTGPEILRQARGKIDAFCDFVGTGSSFGGCAAAFKKHNPNILCYVVEPAGAAVLAGRSVTNAGHRIQGGGYSMKELPLIDEAFIEGYLQVTDEEAMEVTRRLAREEGIFAGFSSGANVAAAMQLLKTTAKGATIAVLLSDSGLKYLSTDLWP